VKVASIIGYFATVIIGLGAFTWVDEWWATVLLVVLALSIRPLLGGFAWIASAPDTDVDEADVWEQDAYARGLSPEEVDALSAAYAPGRSPEEAKRRPREVGFEDAAPRARGRVTQIS
jgi:hypothetical protein